YPAPASTASVESPSEVAARGQELSRGTNRRPVKVASAPKPTSSASETIAPILRLKITGSKYATTDLNVRTEPSSSASVVAEVDKGTKLAVTKTISNGFRYVSYRDKGRGGRKRYFSDNKPTATSSSSAGGISSAPCPGGSSVESGLTPDAIRVHRALCHRSPQSAG